MIDLTLQQLIDLTRLELDDTAAQPRWSDDFFITAFDEAEHEACFRSRLIVDDVTAGLARIELVADQSEYTLDKRVFEVVGADQPPYLLTHGGMLFQTSIPKLQQRGALWRTHTATNPREYLAESLPSRQIRLTLYPRPVEQDTMDTLVLPVYRYPLQRLQSLGQVPEIDPAYHRRLVDWAVARAYMERDQDRYDPVKADKRFGAFEASFGKRDDARIERLHRERRSSTTVARPF